MVPSFTSINSTSISSKVHPHLGCRTSGRGRRKHVSSCSPSWEWFVSRFNHNVTSSITSPIPATFTYKKYILNLLIHSFQLILILCGEAFQKCSKLRFFGPVAHADQILMVASFPFPPGQIRVYLLRNPSKTDWVRWANATKWAGCHHLVVTHTNSLNLPAVLLPLCSFWYSGSYPWG